MKEIEILSLTQEIHLNERNSYKIEVDNDGNKNRRKYKPRIIDEQHEDLEESFDVEKRMENLRKELEVHLSTNEEEYVNEETLAKGEE